MAQSLEALMARAIDYAGLFPPAGLPMEKAQANYESYRTGAYQRFLNRMITREVIRGAVELAGPSVTYREAMDPPDGELAKIRTGGLTADKIPGVREVAEFIRHQARARRAFKATAGLHHAVRGERELTYEPNAPRAVMHGFLNVLLAAVYAWHGRADAAVVEGILAETDAGCFVFSDEGAEWRGQRVSTAEIAEARRLFAHSFGSCSFEEPVEELRKLGLIA